MAIVVNDPTAPTSPGPVASSPPAPVANPAGTPVSNDLVTYNQLQASAKVKGTAEADRLSTKELIADKDHVIATGDGNDVFIFRQDDATNPALRNAVVDMGGGDQDQIVMANQLSDYQITFRDNGSIKFEFIGDFESGGALDNAAITFQGAELFTFRNINYNVASGESPFYEAQTFTLEELMAQYGLM